MKRIYLDNAAVTPIDPRVMKEMRNYSDSSFGNPASIHQEGVKALSALTSARASVASFLNAHPDEIVFTGSGTESNNLAVVGIFERALGRGENPVDLHAIFSEVEHPSILECAEQLQKKGVRVDYVGVDERGIVNLAEFKKMLRKETFLVSIMAVNNEIGTLMPIKEIAKAIRHYRLHNPGGRKIAFHTDASQAPLYLELDVEKLGVDALTLDSHKVYGPRGVGMLYLKRATEVSAIMHGGGQERGLRPGTENLPAIAGFRKSLELAKQLRNKETASVCSLRDYFLHSLQKQIPGIELNGDAELRIANNLNVSIPGIDSEFLVLQLDACGIACSTKSSCLRDEDESYVIRALGKPDPKNAVRFSLGRFTKKADIKYAVGEIVRCVMMQRSKL